MDSYLFTTYLALEKQQGRRLEVTVIHPHDQRILSVCFRSGRFHFISSVILSCVVRSTETEEEEL